MTELYMKGHGRGEMMSDTRSGYAVRRMRRGEVALIRDWAAAEGWNPGLHDAACFYETDPDGFFLGELGGEPIACLSCVAYDDSFGFVGHYIVRPEFRGQGYGIQIWRAGMAHLGTRNVGLDGVLAQVGNYERSGFATAYHHLRYQGRGGGRHPAGVVRLSAVPFDDVLAYDRRCFPAPRPGFLRGWLALPESVSLGCVRQGRLAGFGVMRVCVDGFRIGPLFADDLATAEALLHGLAAETDDVFYADVPDETANPAAAHLVGRFGMKEVWRCARMYTRGRPRLDARRIFGNTTLELG